MSLAPAPPEPNGLHRFVRQQNAGNITQTTTHHHNGGVALNTNLHDIDNSNSHDDSAAENDKRDSLYFECRRIGTNVILCTSPPFLFLLPYPACLCFKRARILEADVTNATLSQFANVPVLQIVRGSRKYAFDVSGSMLPTCSTKKKGKPF
jgi:hypothetical protein